VKIGFHLNQILLLKTRRHQSMVLTYKKAGVDIVKIKKSHAEIGRIIKATHMIKKGPKIVQGFGHYAGIVEIPNGLLLATHTDGVGTKVLISNMMKKYDTIGIDCVAMNVNDIICVGAKPISFVDYIAANKNNERIFKKIVEGLAKGAQKADIPIVGGETAVMPDLLVGKGFLFDLAGTVVGLLPKHKMILGKNITKDNVIVGAKSTGLHSNGFSLARKTLLQKYSINDKIKGIGVLGDALLTPTEIYVKPVLEIIEKCKVNGLAHITGGSFTKLLRLKKVGFELDSLPRTPRIMELIEHQGVSKEEMYKTFNMGIGFCVIVQKDEVSEIKSIFKKHKIFAQEIGKITDKPSVIVNSKKIA
jgi:phosphoribosylformylglycinamidine cyclo-ligase